MKFREKQEEKERLLDLEHYRKRIKADTLFLEKRDSYLEARKNNRRKLHGKIKSNKLDHSTVTYTSTVKLLKSNVIEKPTANLQFGNGRFFSIFSGLETRVEKVTINTFVIKAN